MVKLIPIPKFRITAIILGCFMVGCLLVRYKATLAIWLVTEIMILHLAWVGTGAITLAVVGTLGILWSATLATPITEDLAWPVVHLDPAQAWAIQLLITWALANGVIFILGLTAQFFHTIGSSRIQTFYLMVILPNLGLALAQFSRLFW
jgi:hypothetical protein